MKGGGFENLLINKQTNEVTKISRQWNDLLLSENGNALLLDIACSDSGGVYFYDSNYGSEKHSIKELANNGALCPP
jgi:mevalonate kinase